MDAAAPAAAKPAFGGKKKNPFGKKGAAKKMSPKEAKYAKIGFKFQK